MRKRVVIEFNRMLKCHNLLPKKLNKQTYKLFPVRMISPGSLYGLGYMVLPPPTFIFRVLERIFSEILSS